jgi:hypothetical protein
VKSGPCCIYKLCELCLTFHLEGEKNLSNLKCSGHKIYWKFKIIASLLNCNLKISYGATDEKNNG